ncbi:MAG TPA: SRPBCC family protein [Nitrososphaeraceae archaeon]|jgi:carbon monoxide dehydrogenase subunit G|nr:SRPBCC family protein [Nitrososphaeraceae archaeon]
MVTIHASRELAAPLDKVWEIVADVDREPEFWHGTKSIKNIKKIGKIIEREVIISFRNSICKEIVTIDPKKSVKIRIIDGPMKGTKNIIINDVGNNKTRIDVEWDIKLAGFLGMFTRMVKKHISEGTEEALERISKTLA